MVIRKHAYKYKTAFQDLYETTKTWKNGTVIIQVVTVTARLNIRHLKPYNNPEVERAIHLHRILSYIYEIHNIYKRS